MQVRLEGLGALTQDNIDKINKGQEPLSLVGHVVYRDVFNKEHTSRWNLRYDVTTKAFYGDEIGNDIE